MPALCWRRLGARVLELALLAGRCVADPDNPVLSTMTRCHSILIGIGSAGMHGKPTSEGRFENEFRASNGVAELGLNIGSPRLQGSGGDVCPNRTTLF